MKKWKVLAMIFTLISYAAIKETFRIFTSSAKDVAVNRSGLKIIAVTITVIVVLFTIRFWRKTPDKRLY